MKNNGKSFGKGKFLSFKNYKKDFKKKDVRESSPPQGIVCYECNGHGHLKECLNYLRGRGKELTSTLSNLESSNSGSEEGCDGDGNYFAFMAITLVDSKEELRELVEELGVHINVEEDEVSDGEEMYLNEGDKNFKMFIVKLCFTTMFYVGFNSVSNLIIILLNHFLVFLWDLM